MKACGIGFAMIWVGLATAAQAQTLTPSEPVTIKRIVSNGTGCPIGTTAQNVADDKTAFTLTFSDFTAEAGPQLPPEAGRKNCVLTLTLGVPAGWQYSIGSFYYRGFMGLDPGIRATHLTKYFFEGQGQTGQFQVSKQGPAQEDFVYTDQVGLSSAVLPDTWSPCNAERALNINVSIQLQNTNPRVFPQASGLVTQDSVDGAIKQVYGLSWRQCGDSNVPAAKIPVHRLVNTASLDHLFTLDPEEGKQWGYLPEGVAFWVLRDPGADRLGLYRCYMPGSPGSHFVATDPRCEGQVTESLLGYLFTQAQGGARPVYRCQGLAIGIRDFLTTLNDAECRAVRYTIDGILGYAP